ncbi:MAG: hypothetical protein EOM70_08745, partial [Clostridia bacterium]|nr:hypothetical protein [Clostridia bacterium]
MMKPLSKIIKSKVLVLCLILAFMLSIMPATALAASEDEFTQFSNDSIEWINGNLNVNKSTYYEGMSVPQRIVITGLDNAITHELTIKHEFTKSGKYAYDFLTSWDQSIIAASRIGGQTWSDQSKWLGVDPIFKNFSRTAAFPDNVTLAKDKESAYEKIYNNRTLTVYGNDAITSLVISDPTLSGSASGDSTYSVKITWFGSATKVMILFGAHLAAGYDLNPYEGIAWGPDKTGSASINGSPYHVSLGGASQDNQLQEALVKYNPPAPAISIDKKTNGSDINLSIQAGSAVTWSYLVTNTGNVTLSDVAVVDDNGTPESTSDDITVGTIASLAPGASQTLSASGTAVVGAYTNIATVTGNPPDGQPVSDTDSASYTG